MVDILPKENPVIDKEQISRILDIEPDIDSQNECKQTIYILNGAIYEVPADMTTDQCLELVKLKTIARKRNYSNESEDSSDNSAEKQIFGKKEVIYIDRQEGDSLQKLALTFNCTIAEIKFANKIYNEQELHALRTVKVPVVKDGSLYHRYNESKVNENKETAESTFSDKNLQGCSGDDVESKYKFRVQTPYAIEPHLNYLSDDGSEYDIYEVGNSDKEHLLADKTVFINKVHAGYPVNISDSTLPDFINKMDEKIKKDIEELESKNENLEEVVSTLDQQVVFPMDRKVSREAYGSVCSLTWKHFVVIVCFIAVVIPTIYLIHFFSKNSDSLSKSEDKDS